MKVYLKILEFSQSQAFGAFCIDNILIPFSMPLSAYEQAKNEFLLIEGKPSIGYDMESEPIIIESPVLYTRSEFKQP